MNEFNPEKIQQLKKQCAKVPVTVNLPMSIFEQIENLCETTQAKRTDAIIYVLNIGLNEIVTNSEQHQKSD